MFNRQLTKIQQKMVLIAGIGLSTFLLSCSKEATPPIASLSLHLESRSEEIEWAEITGVQSTTDATAYLDARGYNDEHFFMHLNHIKDTGTLSHPTIQNIFFTDGLGYQPKKVKAGYIRITERQTNRLNGRFEIRFGGDDPDNDNVEIKGSFSINTHR